MIIKAKKYDELLLDELFEIFELRQDVFVVEQACPYKDIDYIDKLAWHLCGFCDGELVAYARVFIDEHAYIRIGRVLSKYRGKGFGRKIFAAAIDLAKDLFDSDQIMVESQAYAKDFYGSFGFIQVSEEFLDVGIPHVRMVLKIKGE